MKAVGSGPNLRSGGHFCGKILLFLVEKGPVTCKEWANTSYSTRAGDTDWKSPTSEKYSVSINLNRLEIF